MTAVATPLLAGLLATAGAAASPLPTAGPGLLYFERRYSDLHDATQRHDGGAVAALLAPEFRVTNESGRAMDRAGYVAFIAAPPQEQATRYEQALRKLHCTADRCTLEVAISQTLRTLPGHGAEHVIEMSTVAGDVWRRDGDRWLLAQSDTTHVDQFIDKRLHVVRDYERTAVGVRSSTSVSSSYSYKRSTTSGAVQGPPPSLMTPDPNATPLPTI